MTRSFAVLVAFLLCGCTEVERARMKAAQERARKDLSEKALRERAEEYWEGVRWRQWDMAALAYKEPSTQKRFLDEHALTDPQTLATIDSLEIVYIFVSPSNFDEGHVRVRWTEVPPRSTHIEKREAEQLWFREAGRWWLGEAPSPAGDEPVPDLPTVSSGG
jgi:hypothetical protein